MSRASQALSDVAKTRVVAHGDIPTNRQRSLGAISPIFTVIIIIILVPLGLFVGNAIGNQVKYNTFKAEIDRVKSITGTGPTSVACHSGSLAAMCYAEYESLNRAQAKAALNRSGYLFEGDRLSATNAETSMSVSIEGGVDANPVTIRYKDIATTL